jgi:hypothetical protein
MAATIHQGMVYRRNVRRWILLCGLAVACGHDAPPPSPPAPAKPPTPVVIDASTTSTLPAHRTYPDLPAALAAIIPTDARVIGVGELHARVDRAPKRTSLAAFTQALSTFGDRVSDLVLETWIVDPKCGKTAVEATKRVETTVKRPEATKSEVAQLADAAKAAGIRPHAMTLSCKDYETVAPQKGDVDPVAMLTLTTRELTRIATSAIAFRDKDPAHRPWIVVYGGALHNDRFPDKAVAEWSYAAAVDAASANHFVEIDLFVPEFAEADETSRKQPWFPLVGAAGTQDVTVWQRGERSFVILLPRSAN